MRFILKIVSVTALLCSLNIFADDLSLDNFPCKKSILEELNKFGFQNWRPIADPSMGVKAYRGPSNQFGVWNELRFTEDKKNVKLYRINTEKFEITRWDPSCKKTSEEKVSILKDNLQDKKENWFSDKDLMKALKKHKKGIVYIWSPSMVYSMREYHIFKNFSKKNGFVFIPILDEKASKQNAMNAADQYKFDQGSRKLASVELMQRTSSTHFPKTYVFSNQKISRDPILGVMPEKTMSELVQKKLAILEQQK